jgi:hypothetical protein
MGQFSVEKPVAPGSVLSGNQQAHQKRPVDGLGGVVRWMTPVKARKAASGQIWGSWSDAGPPGVAADQSTVPSAPR